MKQPKISIIVPIYKAEDTIRRLLDSFMSQPCEDIEFFLIDNASPDRCGEICQEYVEKDSRFVLHILKENIGYIRARMYGINNCNGEYVGFADSDDFVPKNCYQELTEIIKREDPDFITCGYYSVNNNESNYVKCAIKSGFYTCDEIRQVVMPHLFGNCKGVDFSNGFMWKNLYRKNIIIKNKINFHIELMPYEDQIFNIDFAKCSQKVLCYDKPIYCYVANDNSITAKETKNFDLVKENERVSKLFSYKLERSNNDFREEIANDAISNYYPMYLCAAKYSTREEIDTLNNISDISIFAFVKMYAKPYTKTDKVVYWFLSNNKPKQLVKLIRFLLKF